MRPLIYRWSLVPLLFVGFALAANLVVLPGTARSAAFDNTGRAAPQPPGSAASLPRPPLPSFAEPSISPDGSEIAFVSAGDVWTMPSTGGEARLLVSHVATESRPLYSPDGTRLAFVSSRTGNGDVYVLTFATGDVKRLTYDDAPDQLDGWSQDGKWVYFSSAERDLGAINHDVYRVRADGGTPMPVIGGLYSNEFGAAPSPDGASLAFCAGGAANRDWWRKGHAHWDESQIWLMREPPASASASAPAPGRAASRATFPASGPAGRDTAPTTRPSYEPLTPPGAKDQWPMWAPDGRTLYYVSDRDGAPNIWACPPASSAGADHQARRVTSFHDGRVLWPSVSYDGKSIVFEREFGIWRLDTKTGEAHELKVSLRGAPQTPGVLHQTFGGGWRELALSPDGRKVAVVVHGEVFAAPSSGGPAARVTHTTAAEAQVDWSPDSRRLVYTSERGAAAQNVFLYDFATDSERPVTSSDADDSTPRFSPDGRSVAFIRGGGELVVADLATRRERVVARGLNGAVPPFDDTRSPFVWSPKGQWIAYIGTGPRGFDNVYLAAAAAESADAIASVTGAGGAPEQVTFFANTSSNSVSWSPDGRFLLFGTGQRTEDYQLARVNLVPRPPTFVEDQFRGLFQEPERTVRPGTPRPTPPERTPDRPVPLPSSPATTRPAPTPQDLLRTGGPSTAPSTNPADPDGPRTRPVPAPSPGAPERFSLDGVRQRVSLLPVSADIDYQAISPDGKWCVVVASTSGRQNLYVYALDAGPGEPSVLRQITSTAGPKSGVQWAPNNREVWFLDGGQIRVASIDGAPVRDVTLIAPMDVDFAAERAEVGRQAWRYLRLNFFDPNFHGVDWDKVRENYFPRFAGARTPDELRRLIALMIGELDASHLGVGAARTPPTVGHLGLQFDRAAYESSGHFRVAEVIPYGPAAVGGIKAGDYLLSVDGEPLGESTNLDALLDRKIGRRVAIIRAASASGTGQSEVAVMPVDVGTEKTLAYRAWVEQNRSYVEKASRGRLGYVHIPDMGRSALTRLAADLDARCFGADGVVVDVRGNTGGFASPFVLDVFARKGYLTMTRRGAEPAAGRPYVGQRSLERPTVLVANRQSVSDAENFVEGYRALGLGKVVGEPTAGGVIFTSETQLLDGTLFRIPFSKVSTVEGSNLEWRPRPVDVRVDRPVGEEATGTDSQLDAAVRELIKQIDRLGPPSGVTQPPSPGTPGEGGGEGLKIPDFGLRILD